MNFLMMKNMVFFSQKIDGNMIFTDCWKVLILIFSGIGNIVFFEPKSWWKDDIYWLLERSCFDFFQYWKMQSFFWVKKLMERWYLLVTEKFLFWTFRWWEIQSFLQRKCWWKDDIYMVFLSLGNMVFRAVKVYRGT